MSSAHRLSSPGGASVASSDGSHSKKEKKEKKHKKDGDEKEGKEKKDKKDKDKDKDKDKKDKKDKKHKDDESGHESGKEKKEKKDKKDKDKKEEKHHKKERRHSRSSESASSSIPPSPSGRSSPSMSPVRGDAPNLGLANIAHLSVEQRLLTLESAERRQTREIQRSAEYMRSQMASIERITQQRFESLEARFKGLDTRFNAVTGAVTDIAQNVVEELMGGQNIAELVKDVLGKQEVIQRQSSFGAGRSSESDGQLIKNQENLFKRQEHIDAEMERLQEQYLYAEDRLQQFLDKAIDMRFSMELATLTDQLQALSATAATSPQGGNGGSRVSTRPDITSKFSVNDLPSIQPFAPANLPHPSPHPKFLSLTMGMREDVETRLTTISLPESAIVTEQVNHLSEALSLWATRQRTFERRLGMVESQLGIRTYKLEGGVHDNPSETISASTNTSKSRSLQTLEADSIPLLGSSKVALEDRPQTKFKFW